jgi:hypothetical protein
MASDTYKKLRNKKREPERHGEKLKSNEQNLRALRKYLRIGNEV